MSHTESHRATKTPHVGPTGELRVPTLQIRNLQHYYGEGETRKQVLFDCDLDVYPGEIVIMTGPSGSGKTTLLTLIGTLRTVQEGQLQVLGRALHGATGRQRLDIRRQIGFIFQAHNLFGSLSAIQNVSMALELAPFTRAEINDRATRLLARLGLKERLHYKPQSLSGGQKQRVAIARGLAHSPKIVLADEPTAALDEKSGREVVTLFQELAREHQVSIVMVTHDNRILDVADRVVNMVDGRIKSDVVVREAALICEFIQKTATFSRLTPATLATVADKMWTEEYLAGEVIIRQGEQGDKFYLVRRGEAEVLIDEGAGPERVHVLSEGDTFGEWALLSGEKRAATVRATQPTLLYALGKDDYCAALDSRASFQQEMQKALFDRQ